MDTAAPLPAPAAPFISSRVLVFGTLLALSAGVWGLDRQVLSALVAGLPGGSQIMTGVGLVGALGFAALLRGLLVPQSSERWFRYGLGCGFWLVPSFFLPMFFPEDPVRFFVLGALSGMVGVPLALAFPRHHASAIALHVAILTALLGVALLYVLVSFVPEPLARVSRFFGRWVVFVGGGFVLLCLSGGYRLGSRAVRFEPVYKGIVVGMTGGALLAILVRLLSLPF